MRQREEMEMEFSREYLAEDLARRDAGKRQWDEDQERLARGEIIVESTFDRDPF